MKTKIHRSEERGHHNYGWLDTHYSFSFSNYYDPEKMGFGMLRVLNDDIVEGGQGFPTHPHNNMEIITIMLEGALEHKDSMGTGSVIHKGEVQVMSAGTGITHSEFNHSKEEKLNLLQIWIFPKEQNIKPRYDQRKFNFNETDKTTTIVSGIKKMEDVLYIHQNAELNLARYSAGKTSGYKIKKSGNGVYLFVIEGKIEIDNDILEKRDAMEITDSEEFKFNSVEESLFLIIEVPMQ